MYENLLNTSPDIDPRNRCSFAAVYNVSIINGNKERRKEKATK